MRWEVSKFLLALLVFLGLCGPAYAGRIVAWGSNWAGQCDVPLGWDFVAIAAGYDNSLGLKENGSIVAWGDNDDGECDIPSPNMHFSAVSAGGLYHSLGLKEDGSVVAWGDNYHGQCDVPLPNTHFFAVAAGSEHSIGLKNDGSIVAWGKNLQGQCDVPSPNSGFVTIAAGGSHSLGLKDNGSIVAWGNNGMGQCDVPSPNTGFVAVAAGGAHSLAIKEDDSVVAWGYNDDGQCDVPVPNTGFVAVAAGRYHSLGLKNDGSIVAWGDNGSGLCDVPSPNIGFVAVAAGVAHSLALVDPLPLISLEIIGPTLIYGGYGAEYKTIAHYDNDSTRDVTAFALWKVEPNTFASIEGGLLTTTDVNEPQYITIYAEYAEGEVTLRTQMAVEVSPPQIRYVPSEYPTIQSAINNCNDGDIVIVAPGTYTGEGNRNISYLGKAITVRSENGPANCIIDCNSTEWEGHRGFYFDSEEDGNSVLDGLTITNGHAGNYGGAIYCSWNSSPTIINCNITGNLANYKGGGIYCGPWSSPTIANCTISNNTAGWFDGLSWSEGYGGGIFCLANSTTVIDCIINGNIAGDSGGGIYCGMSGSNITIINSTITENIAYGERGGGIFCGEYSLTINNCTITDNIAKSGGGIHCNGKLQITNSSISANRASMEGGGLSCYYSWQVKITNSNISANRADDNGGGIYFSEYRDAILTNCTISSNTSGVEGGGMFCENEDTKLSHCILWGNLDPSGTGTSAQIHYLYGLPEVQYSCIQDDDPNDEYIPFNEEQNYNIDDDPIFVREPNDGGDGWGDDTETPHVDEGANDDLGDLHLQYSSPCINSGNPYFYAAPSSLDIDSQPRILALVVDMGADEFEPVTVVTKPEADDVFSSGSIQEIQWSGYGVDSIDILFSKDAGHNWHTIESNLPITGSYTWHLPDIIDSNKCLIKVVPSIPDANFIYITSGLFTIHPYNPDTAVDAKWRSLGGDFRRTGLSENFGLDLGCIKWQFDTNGPVISSITIGYDDRVHIASEDGTLYTLDTNGVILWNYDTNSPLLSSPTIGLDGTVYVGAENGKLFALDRQGELRWTYSTNGFIYSSPAVSEDGRVYFCSEDGTICALAPDGSKLWSFQTNGPASLPDAILASPAIAADSTVYIAGLYDPNLYALEPNDGSVKWACNFDFTFEPEPGQDFSYTDITPPMLFASPVVADDGTIYQALVYDTNLYAIDPNDGNIIWSTDLGDIDTGWFEPTYYVCEDVNLILEDHNVGSMVLSEPALGPDGTIYVSLDDPHLRAVGPDGTIKWVTRLDSSGGFTLTVGLDGLIYAADDDGSVYVVNENGWEIGRFDGIGPLSFPVIAADNTMFVSDANNKVWAIQAGPCEDRQLVLHLSGREDINGDGNIDFLDFATMADQWLGCTYPFDCSCWGAGGSDCPEGIWDTLADQWQSSYLDSDIDRDGRVDLFDFAAFADRWLGARPSRPPRQPPKEIWTDYWSSYEEIEWLERGSLSRWWYWCE